MMNLFKKNIKLLLLISCFFFTTAYSPKAEAIEPKVKAVLTMAAYGTVGGALLGAASLAFDTGGRSVAIGASLGLYAGIIFGSFIVVSHKMRKYRQENPVPKDNYYPGTDGQSPYENDSSGGSWFGGGDEESQRWQHALSFEDLSPSNAHDKIIKWKSNSIKHTPTFYMNLWNYQF